ncbi:hypothetical protein B6E78_03285 [Edwardsiella ictaluri]|nr:hypothetical protein B6E78_03285 [Edwardsiella ictaluri]
MSLRFQLTYTYEARKPGVKERIVDLAFNGSGVRDTARILNSLRNSCVRLSKVIKMILLTLKQYVKPHPDHPCVLSSLEQKDSRRCEHCIGSGNHLSETR